MLTVVISKKNHIEQLKRYDLFLHHFENKNDTVFCEWNPSGESLAEMVPMLEKTVKSVREWRAVVICDDKTEALMYNPFDITRDIYQKAYDSANKDEPRITLKDEPTITEEEDYQKTERELKIKNAALSESYRTASSHPFVKLVTWLSVQPFVSVDETAEESSENDNGNDGSDSTDKTTKKSFGDDDRNKGQIHRKLLLDYYRKKEIKKQEFRTEILEKCDVKITLPARIYAIALRNTNDLKHYYNQPWTISDEKSYSEFTDRNMYYDSVRFLTYDLIKETHALYAYEYIKFLVTLLLFAGNELPLSTLNPNRLYNLFSVDNEKEIGRLFMSYDEKLLNTANMLQAEIDKLKSRNKLSLTDNEAEKIFVNNSNISVTLPVVFDLSKLKVSEKKGMSFDCPKNNEGSIWKAENTESTETLKKLLKQPPRSISRAIREVRAKDSIEDAAIKLFNNFQLEDVREKIDDAEHDMLSINTSNIYDYDRYTCYKSDKEETIERMLEKRIKKSSALIWGGGSLAAFLIGFIPFYINNIKENFAGSFVALYIFLCALLGLGAVGMIVLLVYRRKIRQALIAYNYIMSSIEKDVRDAMNTAGRYLSQSCNMLRGNSVLNYYYGVEEQEVLQIRLCRKHIDDINRYREGIHNVFDQFMQDKSLVDETLTEPYERDFKLEKDYTYPLPIDKDDYRQIEFAQPGNLISVPTALINRVGITMEELYD